jgi:hypothetical protein
MNTIIEYGVNKEELSQAKQEALAMGRLRNSILKGAGNAAGLLSEIILANNYPNLERDSTRNWDLVDRAANKTYDSKAKQTIVEPLPHYECSVANFNPNQKCDSYIFTRVHKGLLKVWVLGYIDKYEFFEKATFHRRGDYDESNNFTFHADCYNLKIEELNPMSEIT